MYRKFIIIFIIYFLLVNILIIHNMNKEKELTVTNYHITINKIVTKEESMENFILHDLNNLEITRKYINKLPYKDIQLKYMNKYDIPVEMGIMINFIESNFSNDLQLHNKCFNSAGGTDLGSMQINTKYHPLIKGYVENNNIEKYYDYAYKHLAVQIKYTKNKCLDKYMQLAILCWNSKNESQQEAYENRFIKRCNKELKIIYGERVYE